MLSVSVHTIENLIANGIGDAVNLAWKLAAVLQEKAKAEVLDSYELERIAFARRLVATTDRAFTTVTSTSPFARLMRLRVIPLVAPLLFSSRALRRLLFRTISQVNVNYRHSNLSRGRVGSVHAGDRLPWVNGAANGGNEDNFAPLRSLNWQLHVYGDVAPQFACAQRAMELADSCLCVEQRDEAKGARARCSLSAQARWLHSRCDKSE